MNSKLFNKSIFEKASNINRSEPKELAIIYTMTSVTLKEE